MKVTTHGHAHEEERMPTRVLRRTPESEKAAIYGYKDLLRDSLALLGKRATASVERMTSGKMSEGEVLEMALAPAGGMLKVAGTSKLLAGLLKRQASHFTEVRKLGYTEDYIKEILLPGYQKTGRVFREALKVPEKEYGRIKDIGWGGTDIALGVYDPLTKKISLHPKLESLETVWHEFTHARQWSPEKFSSMPKGQITEAEYAHQLQDLLKNLRFVTKEGKMSASEFYQKISPVERHARDVAGTAVSFPREFNRIYKESLRREVAHSREKLHELSRKLEGEFQLGLKGLKGSLPDLAKKVTSKEELMKKFSKQGLKYDAFTEPLPGYGYHQWTFYGEGPLKGATFGTKTTELGEMEAKVTDMMRKFTKD